MKERQKITFQLFEAFFLKALENCDYLCDENEITINNLFLLAEEFRNITTFELSNGWQLDYRIDLYHTEYLVQFDVDSKKTIYLPDIGFNRTFTVYPDKSRCKDPHFSVTAIFQIHSNTYGKSSCHPKWEFDELETFINPRLSLISKMNNNNLKIFDPDYLYSSWMNDTYTFKDTKLYNHRIIQGTEIEIQLMQELIKSLDDIKIIKSCLYKRKDSEPLSGFCLDGKELKLPLKVPVFKKVKKVFSDYRNKTKN